MNNFFIKLIKHPFVITFIMAIVVTIAIIWGVLRWLDSYTKHNEAIVVPDIKGMKMEEAVTYLESSHLRYNVIDSVFSKEVAPGAIVEVVPNTGSKVKEGRILFITINALTSQMATIPEIEDLSFRQAYALLKSRGFNSIEIEYVPGDYKDLAIDVEINGRKLKKGEHVPLTSQLTLIVSSGDSMPDSLMMQMDSLDLQPVEPLNSEVENWF